MGLDLAVLVLALAAPGELTLDACRESARREHPRVTVARAQEAAAAARASLAFSGFLPTVSGDLTWQGSEGPGSLGGAPSAEPRPFFDIWGANLVARQTVWDFGRTLNGYGAASASAEAAGFEREATLQILDVEAEAAFRTAVSSSELVSAMTDARRRAAAHVEQAQARVELGLRPVYDVARAEVELANADLSLVSAQNIQAVSRAQLGQACGLASLGAEVALAPPPAREAGALLELEAAVARAFERRPELRAAERRAAAAREALDAAESSWFPSLGVSGGVGYRGGQLDDLAPGWNALVQLSVPLLSGGADAARIQEALANVVASLAAAEGIRRSVRLEVEAGLLAVREAQARREVAHRLRAAATAGLDLAEARYDTGLGDALELGDAQSALATAEALRVRGDLDVAIALARLERVSGEAR